MDLLTTKVLEEQECDIITRSESSGLLSAVFLGILGEFPGGNTISSVIGWRNNKLEAKQLDARLLALNVELHSFKREIENKVSLILENRLTMPHMHLFGLALESGKYYYKQSEMRELFANLIAKLFDFEMYKVLHPAYIEVIKQLSPLDAKILSEFRPKTPQRIAMAVSSFKRYIIEKDGKKIRVDSNNNEIEDVDETPPHITFADENSQLIGYNFPKVIKPIVSYYVLDKISNKGTLLQGNVVKTEVTEDITLISSSVTNLARLGLIEIDLNTQGSVDGSKEDIYKPFLEKPLLPDWKELSVHPLLRAITVKDVPTNYDELDQTKKLEIKRGIAQLTQFGDNFISACVLEAEFLPPDAF